MTLLSRNSAVSVTLLIALLVVMDQISIKTTNPKFRLYWYLILFIDWRLGDQTSPPPLPWVNKYRGMNSCSVQKGVESTSKSYTMCIWQDSEPTKLLYHPKQILRRGGGLGQINTFHQVPLLVNFFKKSRHLGFGVFIDVWSMLVGSRTWLTEVDTVENLTSLR